MSRTFLVVDGNPDGLALLALTLKRRFPGCVVHQCDEVVSCMRIARDETLDAIIVHRAIGLSAEQTIQQLRAMNPNAPIVMVSGTDRRKEAKTVGASTFLLYDEWLMLGGVVADLINAGESSNPWQKSS